jgi:predicted transcriptional regulator
LCTVNASLKETGLTYRGLIIEVAEKSLIYIRIKLTAGNIKGLDLKTMTLRAGIRQYGLAGQLHMSPGRLSDIESGRRQELPEPLQRIFEAVGATENGETGP